VDSAKSQLERAAKIIKDDGKPEIYREYKKCCPPNHVVHLEKSGIPYCERLHGIDLGKLSPPVPENTQEVTWVPEYSRIPTCKDSSLQIIQKDFFWKKIEDAKSFVYTDISSGLIEDQYCIDYGIEEPNFISTVGVVCVDLDKVCKHQRCLNVCCGSQAYCQLPKNNDMFHGAIARPFSDMKCTTASVNLSLTSQGVRFKSSNLNSSQYCIDPEGMMHDDYVEGRVCESMMLENYYYIVLPYVITILLLISVVSLLVSLVLHVMVPELRSSMFGWMKMCYITSMFWTYLFLFILYIGALPLVFDYPIHCQVIGFLLHYFFLASFFWVNVMSFDIWRTFRHMRGYTSMVSRLLGKKKRFAVYSLYAWGSPLIISAIAVTMEYLPKEYTENFITPGIGDHRCFFATEMSKFLYFHAPVSVLLAANIVFFLLASWALLFGVWAPSANDRIKRQTKQRFSIVVELFFVMGLTWIAEIASWAIGWGLGTKVVWVSSVVFDITNALQGFIIFVIVVMKSRIIRSIKRFILGLPSPSFQSSTKKQVSRKHQDGGSQRSQQTHQTDDRQKSGLSGTLSNPTNQAVVELEPTNHFINRLVNPRDQSKSQ